MWIVFWGIWNSIMKPLSCFLLHCLLSGQILYGQTVLVSEDFESGSLPFGWSLSQDSNSVGWEFGSVLGSNFFPIPPHSKYAASNDDKYDDNSFLANKAYADYLISPAIDLQPYNLSGVVVLFEYVQPGTWNSVGTVEVTTNGGNSWFAVDTLPNAEFWTFRMVNISLFTNDTAVQVAFRHNDLGSWADGFAVDDVVIKSVPANDAALVSLDQTEYVAAGNNLIGGTVMNFGFQTITSLDFSYSINGSPPVTDNLTGLSISLGASDSLIHSIPANLTVPGIYTLTVWVSNVNGGGDSLPSNDTITQKVKTLSSVPVKRVLLENHTSANEGYSPDGLYRMEQILINHSNAIGVCIHDDDAMESSVCNIIQSAYITGIPSGTVDRAKFEEELEVGVPRHNWLNRVVSQLQEIVPVGVFIEDASYDQGNRILTFDVKARFYGNQDGEVRLNAWLTENEVIGSGNGWDQRNYYSFAGSAIGGSSHYYYGFPDPVTNFSHNYVLRTALDGAWGDTASVSTPVIDGDSASKTYSYVLPVSWNEMNVNIIAMVQAYDSSASKREILNCEQLNLSSLITSNREDESRHLALLAFPNPFSDSIILLSEEFSSEHAHMEIFSSDGRQLLIRLVRSSSSSRGTGFVWDGCDQLGNPFVPGVYFIHLKNAEKSGFVAVIKH